MAATATGANTYRNPHIEAATLVGDLGVLDTALPAAANTAIDTTSLGDIGTSLSNHGTTVELDSAGATVAVGDFLLIDAEIMEVTAVTSQTEFTVDRAEKGTTAVAHSIVLGGNNAHTPTVYLVEEFGSTVDLAANASETVAVDDLLLIGHEIMEVVTVTSQSEFDVRRGHDGTAIAAHAENAPVHGHDDWVDISPWVKTVSWPITNEGGDATGAGTDYQETVAGEKPKEGPITITFMKSFTAGKVDEIFEPLARSGGVFRLRFRNDRNAARSATNPEWTGALHSLSGYMPVTGDSGRTDAATVDATAEVTSHLERNPAL